MMPHPYIYIYILLGLGTRIIKTSSPEFRSPPCLKARNKELGRLRHEAVWDSGRLFLIMEQKNAELVAPSKDTESDCLMKARCVFQGSDIRTGDGTPAHELFQEVGATPCTMVSCKISNAIAALKGHKMTQRDAE